MSPVERRERVREHVLERAEADPRIAAAAVIGSLASGTGDDWSDLDLAFGVSTPAQVDEVIEDWTRDLSESFAAAPLLDLARGDVAYRVFLLPDWVQVDLSFAPGPVRQLGERFELLFGPAKRQDAAHRTPGELFGWASLYARHALVGIRRGQAWHAEYCISAVRDHALTLACLRRNLPTEHAKGFDRLPPAVLELGHGALVGSLERERLSHALAGAVTVLLRESEDLDEGFASVRDQLATLVAGL